MFFGKNLKRSEILFIPCFLNEDNLFSPKPLISSSDIFSKYFIFLSTTIKQYLKRFKMKVPNN